jgi:glycosyltransferase involved in cell wall biosynthesis
LPARCGRKFYLVQDYEYYMSATPEERARIACTFRMGMTMLAISPAIAQMLQREGVNEFHSTPNGMNIDFLGVESGSDESQRATIGFPNRGESFKRTADALAAVSIIREKLGADLRFWSFGTRPARTIPRSVEYFRFPSDKLLRSLYHGTLIFMVPSQYEGWGLPGSEAMACGAALVSTDNGGVHGYARDNENAVLCPPGRPDLLANAVIDLWNDRPRLCRIAEAGKRAMQQFAWRHAIDRMEKLMLGQSGA